MGAGEVYPGYGDDGWAGGVLYRYPPTAIPGSHIELNLASEPYPRPNEGNSHVFDEVSQMGLRWVSDMASD